LKLKNGEENVSWIKIGSVGVQKIKTQKLLFFSFKEHTFNFPPAADADFQVIPFFYKEFPNLDVSPFMSQCITARNG